MRIERLDAIAKKLPPAPVPTPEPGAFIDDWPGPVRRYLADRFSAAAQPGDDPERAGERAAEGAACGDCLRAIARAARLDRRAPTLPEVQEAVLTGAGNRLAAMLDPARRGDTFCHSGLAWELLTGDSGRFGGHAVYSLNGPAVVEAWWRTGGTDDAETLTLAGIGAAELALLAVISSLT